VISTAPDPELAALDTLPDLWDNVSLGFRERLYNQWVGEALAPTPRLDVARWAEANIQLPDTEPIPGPVRFARSPYLPGVLALFTNPDVTEISWRKSTQVGYTLALICWICYCAEHRRVPVLTVQPKQPSAKRFNKSRVQPIFRASPRLKDLLPTGQGNTDLEVDLLNGVKMRFAGAGSPSDLAEMSTPAVINDEVDKFPEKSGKESDPIKLGGERTRWWHQSLILNGSTPTVPGGYITRETERADCHMRFCVPCPECGTLQVLYFDGNKEVFHKGEENETAFPGPAGRIIWPQDELGHALHTPDEIRQRHLAGYVCGADGCGALWEDRDKKDIIARGEWRTLDGKPVHDHVGVHIWAAYSPMLTFSDIAAEYLASKDNPALHQNFVNSWLGEAYVEKGARPDFEVLVARKAERWQLGTVPEGVRFLVGAIDVHKALQYWSVWGFGAAFTMWLVACGREDVAMNATVGWERVFDAMTAEYPGFAGGPSLRVGQGGGLVLMDSGWKKRHDADPDENVDEAEVIARCDAWNCAVGGPLFQPSKGASTRMSPRFLKWDGKSYDTDRDGKPLKGRLQLHLFDPWFFKKTFYSRLNRPVDDPGAVRLPANVPEEFLRQLNAEEMITEKSGAEVWKKVGPNHGFDTAIMAWAAAWKFRLILDAPQAAPAPSPAPSTDERDARRDGRKGGRRVRSKY